MGKVELTGRGLAANALLQRPRALIGKRTGHEGGHFRVMAQGKNCLPGRFVGHFVPTTRRGVDGRSFGLETEVRTMPFDHAEPCLLDELEQARRTGRLGFCRGIERAFAHGRLKQIVEIRPRRGSSRLHGGNDAGGALRGVDIGNGGHAVGLLSALPFQAPCQFHRNRKSVGFSPLLVRMRLMTPNRS